jgi:hypothetical protein
MRYAGKQVYKNASSWWWTINPIFFNPIIIDPIQGIIGRTGIMKVSSQKGG